MMRNSILVILFLLGYHLSFSQQIKKVSMDDLVNIMDTSSVPLIVNFWASWCQPCIHEIPWFEKNIAQLESNKVKLLLVNLDFPQYYPNGITSFVREKGYRSQIVWLEDMEAISFRKKIDMHYNGTIPVSLFINNTKQYRQYFEQQLTEERFKLELQKLLR